MIPHLGIPKPARSGTSLLAVLVCLIAVSVIVVGALTQSLRLHRQSRQDRILEQTRWVLDAGISRAVAALNVDRKYPGEKIVLQTSLREYRPSLEITVSQPGVDQSIGVEVIATMVPREELSAAIPFQRSLKFKFVPEPHNASTKQPD